MHKIVKLSSSIVSAVVLLTGSASMSHAAPCYSGGLPITLRPIAGGGQFNYKQPSSPTLANSEHWILVDDFDADDNHLSENQGNLASGFIHTLQNSAKQETFTVNTNDTNAEPGLQFSSCSVKAMMLAANTFAPGTAFLIVKVGGTQSDGTGFTVGNAKLALYERTMPLNPITNQPWTTDEINGGSGTIQIGIKNTTNANGNGVGFGSIVFSCQ